MTLIDIWGVALIVVGLVVVAAGAWLASRAVIIDEKTVNALSGTYWDQNLALKQALIDRSRAARNGLVLVAIGSVLQAVGVILPAAANWT